MNDERTENIRAIDSGDVIVPEFVSMFCSTCKEAKRISLYNVVLAGSVAVFTCPGCQEETKVMI